MNFFKNIVRSLIKQKGLSLTKFISLVIAFAVVLVLFEKIQFEENYDQFWNDHESIYRVGLSLDNGTESKESSKTFTAASHLLKNELPEVEAQVNMIKDVITVFYQRKKIQDVEWYWCDSSFFSVLPRKVVAGTGINALNDIHGVAISESFAKKLFGNEDPLNKEISLNEGWKYNVHTVFEDIPSGSHMKVEVLSGFKSLQYYIRNYDFEQQVEIENPEFTYRGVNPYGPGNWFWSDGFSPHSYIKLAKGASIEKIKDGVGPALAKVNLPENLRNSKIDFIFQPIADIHLHSDLQHELKSNGSILEVRFLYLICFIVVLVSLFNFVNLNSISAIENGRNFSIRLINGSGRRGILSLLAGDSFIIHTLALPIAFAIAIFTRDLFVSGPGITIKTIFVLLIVFLISLMVSVLVPYFTLVKTGYLNDLKSVGSKLQQKWSGRQTLVVFQFVITIVLIISSLGIFKQITFMMSKKLGFNTEQTVFSFTPMTMNNHPAIPQKLLTLRNQSEEIAGITNFSVSSSVPGKRIGRSNIVRQASELNPLINFRFKEISVDDHFFSTYQIDIVAGSDFTPVSNWNSRRVILNEKAVKTLNFKSNSDAIGQQIYRGGVAATVVGVVRDYHHKSVKEAIDPTVYCQNLQWNAAVGYYSFRINTRHVDKVMDQVGQIWANLYPKEEFIYYFTESKFQEQYSVDQQFKHILSIASTLALLISCLGLLSLAFYSNKRRIKEIGVRKVNGAKISELLTMLNRDFIRWVLIAFCIACPLAWIAIHKWLESYAYKTSISWWIFALAGGLSIVISMITVSVQSWKAASRNPVEALRYE